MTEVLQSVKFLDIDKLTHKFPADVQDLGIPVTLLHNHSHAPQNHSWCIKKTFLFPPMNPTLLTMWHAHDIWKMNRSLPINTMINRLTLTWT